MAVAEADLCAFCSDLVGTLGDTSKLPQVRPHYPTYGSLLSSSKTCPVCRAIVASWRSVSLDSENAEIRNGYPSKIVVTATRRMSSGVTWKFLEASLISTNTVFSYSGHITLESCASHDPASKLPIWNNLVTTFEQKVSVIRLWLDDCLSHHFPGDCRPVPFSPLRLLAVGQDGRLPRLVARESIPLEEARYAALSHCWGGEVPLRTTRDNVAAFTQEIPWALIPKTFSDAMLMAQGLGIPYVWIDALCIIQDDDEEWQKQAACMGKIYEGSHLTICATQSANSTQGCFPPEVSNHQDIFRTNAGNQSAPDIIVRISRGDIRSRALLGNKLTDRGWTLQEQTLSTRVVSCLQPDVHWYCQSCYQTQSGLIFGPGDMLERDLRWETPVLYRRLLQESHLWQSTWRAVATNYSGRRFTVTHDKIPAIAGLTRYFALAMDDVPLLGLWKNTFGADLSWLRLSDKPPMPSIQGLPSWTWLSCARRIVYNFLDWTDPCDASLESQWMDHVQLLAWEIHWTGTPLASSPKIARVKVDGPVLLIPIATFPTGDTFNPPYLQVFGENLVSTNNITKIPWRCAGQFDAGPVARGEYWCLLLRSRTSNVDTAEIFLVLESVGPKTDMTYKRIGIAKIWGSPPAFVPSRRMSIFLV
ncbi:HET-domain-containing protein [Coniochaeta ligniaria NRRL 30616]|uniref:HET-domain-containing protein n=1 Tax=Coniochaeta ligniaria NRRL 30616 TaxID=1408157 RepID=A0A1J7IMK4_9PEZI|nr:HET-domain-containing protein [Coniochaeta ligniaria NRRL 30616]